MHDVAINLVTLGGILLAGLAVEMLGARTKLPRVTLLLLLGLLVGSSGFGLLPLPVVEGFDMAADLLLMMVGFLLGEKLTPATLKGAGWAVLAVSALAALGAVLCVGLALWALGVPAHVAVLLGCIASATAPAATVETVQEHGSDTPFSRVLLAVVAVDDGWALLIFSFGVAFAPQLAGEAVETAALWFALRDIGGALVLGGLLGVPAAYFTGRLRPGRPMLTEALGLVLLCGGLALWMDVSFMLAPMAMGAVVANLARHHERPFHAIEHIEAPLMMVFFVLAGASLELEAVRGLGFIGVAYLLARVLGKVVGAALGGRVGHAGPAVRRYMGWALLPQAGVAIGMALVAASLFPASAETILQLVIGTTVIFEIIGPIGTRWALGKADLMEGRAEVQVTAD